ncbi:AraC family transcriptional regulator [Kitasatospora sp. NE20-6]|uniref:AraC family transcriptional regulator n=1 Tax=Kitasatospora sp. NE20-6 TaxID=2859066 RepID=UPI0034DB9581
MSTTRRDPQGPGRVPLADRERIDWHFHSVNQLICPARGVLQVSTARGSWAVPGHRAVWIPAGVPHAHRAHGPSELRCLTFAADVNPLALDAPTVLAVSPLLREVIGVLSGPHAPTGGRRERLELVALDELAEAPSFDRRLPTPQDPRLRDVAALLGTDPGDPRTLAELGTAVGASERTLSRLFRRETGMSFPQWRAQLRLQHALTLLATGRTVTATAAACGYATPSSFIEAFRLAFGTTPGRHGRADTPEVPDIPDTPDAPVTEGPALLVVEPPASPGRAEPSGDAVIPTAPASAYPAS